MDHADFWMTTRSCDSSSSKVINLTSVTLFFVYRKWKNTKTRATNECLYTCLCLMICMNVYLYVFTFYKFKIQYMDDYKRTWTWSCSSNILTAKLACAEGPNLRGHLWAFSKLKSSLMVCLLVCTNHIKLNYSSERPFPKDWWVTIMIDHSFWWGWQEEKKPYCGQKRAPMTTHENVVWMDT